MSKAIGMIEFKTTATGITAADTMVKTSDVEIVEAQTVCPGKYIAIITGDLSAVKAAVDAAVTTYEDKCIDSFVLGNPHESLFPAMYGTTQVEGISALGILETYDAASIIEAADQAAKTAIVDVIELRIAKGMCGKSYMLLTGEVSAVEASIEKAKEFVKGILFAAGCLICLALIGVTTYIQYNATFLSTYVESGVRRITLAEKLRKIPLSFFGKKDLSDLTSTIMADCATLETASSHWIPELVGACISTALVAVSLFFFDWRMAIAALWVLPVSFLIVGCSGNVQKRAAGRQMDLKMACADGIQECLETVRDLRANNALAEYIKGLDSKIRAVEKHAIVTELTTAVFVASAQMILKFGIATTALVGSVLLAEGKIDVLTDL